MFNKLVSFTKKVADLADKPALSAGELKAQFDAAPDELRQYFNNLIDALKSAQEGDSGAKNIGVTAIAGLTGTDIQTILEQLAPKKLDDWVNVSTQNGWFHDASNPCQYYKDPFGVVHFRGILKPGNLTSGVVPLTMPVGYRPAKQVDRQTKIVGGSGSSFTTVLFQTGGNVGVYDNLSITALYFDGLSYRTDS